MTDREKIQAVALLISGVARCGPDKPLVDDLYGPRSANLRQRVMEILTGAPRPKSKCGYNETRATLASVTGVAAAATCIADLEHRIDAELAAAVKGAR